MTLLNIFHTGSLTLGIFLFWGIISGWLWFNIAKQKHDPRNEAHDKSVWQNPLAWLFIALTIGVIAIFVFGIAPDYKGV